MLLAISLVFVLGGIIGIIVSGFSWMFTLPLGIRQTKFNLPYIIPFVVALVISYFSAKNLLAKKKDNKPD